MSPRTILSIGNFFLAISATLVGYTLISFLSSFLSASHIGFVIATSALCALVCLPFMPPLVARYGAQQIALTITFVEMVALFAVAALPHTFVSVFLIMFVIALQPLLYYELDLLLEATIDDGSAGRARTFFLTGGSLGALVAPLIIGALLDGGDNYTNVFLAAGTSIVPFIILFSSRSIPRGLPPSIYHMRDTLKHILRHRDLAAVTVGHFILYLFYMWAPFYIPVYLHGVLGISWATLGWMFSIMLIPYVLIEYPAGWLADNMLGDKDLMFAGFIIAGGALAAVSQLTATSSPLVILGILLLTRIGAALIESMTEGHFFRRVSEQDIVSVSVFRGVWPLANIVAPLIASAILFFGNYQLLFICTGGIILLFGGASALLIKDFDPRERRLFVSPDQSAS